MDAKNIVFIDLTKITGEKFWKFVSMRKFDENYFKIKEFLILIKK